MLDKVPEAASEAYLRAALARHAIIPVTAIHEDRALAGAWMRGSPAGMSVGHATRWC